jgi:hypothetical protein
MSGTLLLVLIFIFIFVFAFIIPRYFPKIWNAEEVQVFMPTTCKIDKKEFNKDPESFLPKGFLDEIGKCDGCDDSVDDFVIVEAYLFYWKDTTESSNWNASETITTFTWGYLRTPKKYQVCGGCSGVCTAKELLNRDLSRLRLYQTLAYPDHTAGFQARTEMEIITQKNKKWID